MSDLAGGNQADVSVVIVNWNVRQLLRACIESILSATGASTQIVVVDNASADGSAEMVRSEFPQVELIASDENLGFGRANNVGLRSAAGRYVFFLNPDTILRENTIQLMFDFLEGDKGFDVVGPRLVFPDGEAQPECRLPSLKLMLFHALYLHRVPLVRALMANPAKTLSELGVGHEVDAILGAAMFARRRVIEEVNGFDEEFLYTCEDIDLCLRLRARGSRIFYLADAEVVHFVGRSSAQASLRAGTMSILSMERYFAQSHGRFHALAYRLLVQVVQMPMLITVGLMKTIVNRTGLSELRHRVRFANEIWRWRVSE